MTARVIDVGIMVALMLINHERSEEYRSMIQSVKNNAGKVTMALFPACILVNF